MKSEKKYFIKEPKVIGFWAHGWVYRPRSGAFCTSSVKNNYLLVLQWKQCREMFALHFTKRTKFILMFHKKNEGQKITKFLNEIEKRLKLQKHSSVHGIQSHKWKDCISAIKISPWWNNNAARRSLLTILLRCGRTFNGNFNKTLYSMAYTRKTKKAVQKFFKGYTRINGNSFAGWVREFNNLKKKQIKLIK